MFAGRLTKAAQATVLTDGRQLGPIHCLLRLPLLRPGKAQQAPETGRSPFVPESASHMQQLEGMLLLCTAKAAYVGELPAVPESFWSSGSVSWHDRPQGSVTAYTQHLLCNEALPASIRYFKPYSNMSRIAKVSFSARSKWLMSMRSMQTHCCIISQPPLQDARLRFYICKQSEDYLMACNEYHMPELGCGLVLEGELDSRPNLWQAGSLAMEGWESFTIYRDPLMPNKAACRLLPGARFPLSPLLGALIAAS